ncbi:hypothetical protein Aph01nite_34480 [Acrocarpospora phusangensis]|uniref:Uncharacterized protein n=1 Tax=Acrocarpospora phusangensis TaxID=1070424 RepID=A0A919QCX7_9ACTN|nr:hypothetical protein [Acrocarpospora phusangensis]GIH25138.1 hypothetical protein Aph01nite_34480 [Acrocarpospora phusangensis]
MNALDRLVAEFSHTDPTIGRVVLAAMKHLRDPDVPDAAHVLLEDEVLRVPGQEGAVMAALCSALLRTALALLDELAGGEADELLSRAIAELVLVEASPRG